MNCNNTPEIITQADFNCIGQVAMHCDTAKLCTAINEAVNFDLSELFCGFWEDILGHFTTVEEYDETYAAYLVALAACEADPECDTPPVAPIEPENYDLIKSLLCGGYFEGCGGQRRQHFGIKRIVVYYAYARYLLINGLSDTPGGIVRKTNEFSIPTPLKEIEVFADKYRTMAYQSYKKTIGFLCVNKAMFENFNSKDCKGCGCGAAACGGTKAKGYGVQSSIIRKKL